LPATRDLSSPGGAVPRMRPGNPPLSHMHIAIGEFADLLVAAKRGVHQSSSGKDNGGNDDPAGRGGPIAASPLSIPSRLGFLAKEPVHNSCVRAGAYGRDIRRRSRSAETRSRAEATPRPLQRGQPRDAHGVDRETENSTDDRDRPIRGAIDAVAPAGYASDFRSVTMRGVGEYQYAPTAPPQ
jgi:hypothetical protein